MIFAIVILIPSTVLKATATAVILSPDECARTRRIQWSRFQPIGLCGISVYRNPDVNELSRFTESSCFTWGWAPSFSKFANASSSTARSASGIRFRYVVRRWLHYPPAVKFLGTPFQKTMIPLSFVKIMASSLWGYDCSQSLYFSSVTKGVISMKFSTTPEILPPISTKGWALTQ